MTHDLWTTLNAKMYEYLSSVTLADLVEKQLRKLGGEVVTLEELRRPAGSRTRTLSVVA